MSFQTYELLINNNNIINYNYDDKCDKTHDNTCKSCFYTQ